MRAIDTLQTPTSSPTFARFIRRNVTPTQASTAGPGERGWQLHDRRRRKTFGRRRRNRAGPGKSPDPAPDHNPATSPITTRPRRLTTLLDVILVAEMRDKVDVVALVDGGGVAGQAGAVAHGIVRALQKLNPELRSALKKAGHIKRDPREKERKKAGQPGARKRYQFSKR